MVDKVGGVEFDVSVDATGIDAAVNSITKDNQRIADSFGKVDASSKKAADGMTKSTSKASSSLGGLGRSAGQAGIQIQQLVGQIQGGQNVFGALSAQATDLGIVLGAPLLGAVAGLAAAIAGPLVSAMQSANNEMDKLPEKIQTRLDEIQAKFEETGAVADGILRVEIGKLNAEYDDLSRQVKAAEDAMLENATAMNGSGNQALLLAERYQKLKDEQEELAILMERVTRLGEEQLTKGGEGVTNFEQDTKNRQKGYETRVELLRSAIEAEQEMLSAAAQTAIAIKKGEISELEAAEINADIRNQNRITGNYDRLVAQLDLQRQTVLDNEKLTAEEKAALVSEYDALELEAKRNHDAALLQQAQKFSDKMAQIKEMEEKAKRQAVAGAFANISQLMNTESRKLFEIGKAAALANAVVTGYDAAVTNYKKGSEIGGPPVGAAFAAASLAATFAQIKSIQSTQFGSASAGQSMQGGQVVNNTGQGVGPQQPDRNISIALTGSSFSGDDVRSLIGAINDEIGDGANIFVGG